MTHEFVLTCSFIFSVNILQFPFEALLSVEVLLSDALHAWVQFMPALATPV
jgi:hypothetical protein